MAEKKGYRDGFEDAARWQRERIAGLIKRADDNDLAREQLDSLLADDAEEES